jgi:hypothetical protein
LKQPFFTVPASLIVLHRSFRRVLPYSAWTPFSRSQSTPLFVLLEAVLRLVDGDALTASRLMMAASADDPDCGHAARLAFVLERPGDCVVGADVLWARIRECVRRYQDKRHRMGAPPDKWSSSVSSSLMPAAIVVAGVSPPPFEQDAPTIAPMTSTKRQTNHQSDVLHLAPPFDTVSLAAITSL